MWAILDCGTTNTKCYVIKTTGVLLAETYTPVGCRNNVGVSGRNKYAEFLSDTVRAAVTQAKMPYARLAKVIAFGMISSDLGLLVVPHLVAPVGRKELRRGIYRYEKEIFGSGVEFLIVRGIRNALAYPKALENVDFCDFMRGEETQVMGILECYKPAEPINVITLGTHFKAVHVDDTGCICRSMTTMSGQLFDCIVHKTIVGKSVDASIDASMVMNRVELVALAKRMLDTYGLNRAILLPRFMESFTNMTPRERLIYLDATIAFDDLHSINGFFRKEELRARKYFLVGQQERCENFAMALHHIDQSLEVVMIDGSAKNRDISIAGCLALCGKDVSVEEE